MDWWWKLMLQWWLFNGPMHSIKFHHSSTKLTYHQNFCHSNLQWRCNVKTLTNAFISWNLYSAVCSLDSGGRKIEQKQINFWISWQRGSNGTSFGISSTQGVLLFSLQLIRLVSCFLSLSLSLSFSLSLVLSHSLEFRTSLGISLSPSLLFTTHPLSFSPLPANIKLSSCVVLTWFTEGTWSQMRWNS